LCTHRAKSYPHSYSRGGRIANLFRSIRSCKKEPFQDHQVLHKGTFSGPSSPVKRRPDDHGGSVYREPHAADPPDMVYYKHTGMGGEGHVEMELIRESKEKEKERTDEKENEKT
jgi:hypothetical protein